MAKKEDHSADMGRNGETLKELRELLAIYENIQKERRAALLEAAKREAAGDILTDEKIEEERKAIMRFFSGVKDNRKKKMIARKVNEVAFQAVTIRQAKRSLIVDGLQAEVVNGKQRYPKENPAVAIYDKYCRAYQSNIDKLIELLPPKEVKAKSALASMRDEIEKE
jgi:hypothetical protein